MAYTTIENLSQLLSTNITGSEYFLVSKDGVSYKLSTNELLASFDGVLTDQQQVLTNKIIDDVTNFVHANAIQFYATADEYIPKGSPVKVVPNDDDSIHIVVAQNSEDIFGLSEFEILEGESNTIISFGVLELENTFTEGSPLYGYNGGIIDDSNAAKSLNLKPIGYSLSSGVNGKVLIKTLPFESDIANQLEELQNTVDNNLVISQNYTDSSIDSVNILIDSNASEISNLQTAIDNLSLDITNNKIMILDEGIEVQNTLKLNFIGAEVNSFFNDGENRVDVYIPNLPIPSHFNTEDGSTSPLIQDITTYNRFIGDPDGDYEIGYMSLSSLQPVVRENVTYSTTDSFLYSNGSTIIINVYNGLNIVETLEFLIEEGNFTSDNISASIYDYQNESSLKSVKFSCSIDIKSMIGSGAFKVEIINNDNGNSYTYISDEIFMDDYTTLPSVILDYSFNNETFKYLSGVKFLTSGTTLDYVANLIGSKQNSYPNSLLDINLSSINTILYLTVNDFSTFDKIHDTNVIYSNSSGIYSNKYINGNLSIGARVNDWSTGTYSYISKDTLLDTYLDNSTRIYEDFRFETYRLNSALIEFNSTLILEQDELQVIGSKLIYPQEDFSRLYNNPDYSSYTGTRTYIRKFWHTGYSHSNGVFSLSSNLTETEISNDDFKIEISLDGNIWYNLNEDYIGGVLVDGSGCRINSDTNTLNINNKIEFTLGLDNFTNSASGYGIYCKITISENIKNKYIDSIEIINW